MFMSVWLQAGFWGLVSGSALIIGALIGFFANVHMRVVASIMAFGSGVLISALSFDLMDEAYHHGGLMASAVGFLSGAVLFTAINFILAQKGAKHRKRSGTQQPRESESGGSGLTLAIGALIDGIPESIVIGLSLLSGGKVSFVAVVAVFLSNLPEGLSSAKGMKNSGRSAKYIFTVWGTIALISGVSAISGVIFFENLSHEVVAASTALAAGAILAMIADTMIPEAFEIAHNFAGLITTFGFLTAFFLTKMG